jgi:hypothetical protein
MIWQLTVPLVVGFFGFEARQMDDQACSLRTGMVDFSLCDARMSSSSLLAGELVGKFLRSFACQGAGRNFSLLDAPTKGLPLCRSI